MEKANQNWSVIIFCYNEEGNLRKVTGEALKVLDQMSPPAKELIIVDDGSADGSFEIAERLAQANPVVRVIRHKKNLGIGAALRTGYKAANYENICAIPADGQFDVTEILPFADVPEKTIISFYRTQNLQYSPWRETLSFINQKLNTWILRTDVIDVNWVKIYKRDELKKLNLALTSSLVESEICSKMILNGNRLVEVKSQYLKRNSGRDKGASLKIVRQAVSDMFLLVREYFRFKKSLKNVDGF